ncbi:efflux RND transporter permease subunit [Barnesiella sp. An55]|uniref:efflux RND transporter permease subunit n=1 Tax=Barnesiella sp. An55 TaxID=1965646 RepID=UPI000B3901F8|nr:efflux RND transporter permease subunit [Barnesiella sp. An55]OUN73734.1 hydrophobe/amphiphile efflux-1 family RND transporter [Barnesiella sp. An55]
MKIRTFIDRPIFAGVISVLILILGLIGLTQLPIEQFPEIAPPTVSVSASYTGANAETVQKSVVVPLEEALNGVENMTYMTSTSSNNGSARITVYFRQGTDPDMATVNVQNRLASAQGLLPAEVTRSGVNVRKRQTSNIKQLAVYSPDDSFDRAFLANYMKINIEPRLSRIAGVGEVNVFGYEYAMRIWLDPSKMKKYGLVPSDITGVLDEQNIEAATGTLGAEAENTFQYVLKYRGRYEKEVDYENMVIKSLPSGEVLRLKDVATVELGTRSYDYIGEVNGHPGCIIMISQTSGSNANEIIKEIDRSLEEISKTLPKGIKIVDLMSTKDFLDASIKTVVKTLLEAILLVVLVVYIFLQSFRSTFIPAVSIIVSLVGTFAFLYVVGFSLNMLTLFALVLVIGTVVDDAIVVVEAVQAKFDEGYKSAYLATIDAMDGITSALVTTTFVFMAVFIPVSFIGGTTGTFYTQFGLTMAAAVAISLLNALTLSPALCALIMTPHQTGADGKKLSFSSRFHMAFDSAFHRLVMKYKNGVFFMLKRKWLAGVLLVIACVGFFVLLKTTKTGLVPNEDMGTVFVDVRTSPGNSVYETRKVIEQVDSCLNTIPQIEVLSSITGNSMLSGQGACNGMFTIRLKDWSERPRKEDAVDAIIEEIQRRTAFISSADIMAFTRPMIPGYGASSGFEVYVQDQKGGSIEDLLKYTRNFLTELNKRPEIGRATTSFDTKFPQYLVEVDAALCKRNGVSPTDVLSTLSGYIGGNYASNMNRFSKLYRVMVQAPPQFRLDTEALNNIFVRNDAGEMSPVSQYLKLTRIYGSEVLTRFNLFSAIQVNGAPATGYSSGQAIQAVKEVAAQTLPTGYGFEFGGMSREESNTGNTTTLVFVICVVFIYLILCALYESLFIPLAVILSVPFGLAGSFLFAKIFGLENNIYLQTGLIMLIGLLSKTAILLTEYASERRRHGMTISQAAISAAQVRLRPILMTSLTMIFGMLPMMFASGVGANGNISIGVGTVGGMLIGTIALLFIVPVLFIVFQTLQEKLMPARKLPKIEEKK